MNTPGAHMTDIRQSAPFVNLIRAFGQAGCPVCRIGHEHEFQFIDTMSYERVNEPELRVELLHSLGFCPLHSRQLTAYGDPLGNAILHEALLNRWKERLDKAATQAFEPFYGPRRLFRQETDEHERLQPRGECPLCASGRRRERDYLEFLLDSIGDPQLLAAYRDSAGLCRPHLTDLAALVDSRRRHERFAAIARLEADILDRLAVELRELMRKHDYRFADEPKGPERDSWMRAIWKMAGYPQSPGDR